MNHAAVRWDFGHFTHTVSDKSPRLQELSGFLDFLAVFVNLLGLWPEDFQGDWRLPRAHQRTPRMCSSSKIKVTP